MSSDLVQDRRRIVRNEVGGYRVEHIIVQIDHEADFRTYDEAATYLRAWQKLNRQTEQSATVD